MVIATKARRYLVEATNSTPVDDGFPLLGVTTPLSTGNAPFEQ